MAARAFGPPTFAYPEGRETLVGAYYFSGGALLHPRSSAWKGRHFWSRGARYCGRGVLERALVVAARAFGPPQFCVEGSSLLVSRGAIPWQGRTLEGSGGSGARFWTPAVLRGKVVTFGLEGRDTVAGAYSRGLWR